MTTISIIGQKFDHNLVSKKFNKIQKTYFKYVGAASGVSLAGLALGSAKYGVGFPAKALRTVGDAFGAIAALSVPFLLGKNEINEYKRLKHGTAKGTAAEKHSINELLYRCVSIGFLPYIFESLIDPKKISSSKTQLFTTIVNIPNLLFTGITFGLGSFNSILAWILRAKEQFKFDNEQKEEILLRKHCFNQIYSSTKRLVTIGSIALPAMHGLKRFGEAIDSVFKDGLSMKESLKMPLTTMSRILNLGIGLPEVFAKSFDSIARIAQEIDHLKAALPKTLISPIERFSKHFDKQVSSDSNNILKTTRNLAEVIFHTLSPISQLAFIAPVLDQKTLNNSFVEKIIGIYGKASLFLTTIPYIFISRFPQTVAQCIYFGRYYYGKHIKKESNKDIQRAVENIQDKICNFPIIKQTSKKVELITNHILPDYNEHEFPSFTDIQANYSFAQAQEVFKDKLQSGYKLTKEESKTIIDFCLNYAEKSSSRAFQKLTNNELVEIQQKIEAKIDNILNPQQIIPRKTNIKFPGAYLLAHYLRPFNFVRRIKALGTQSPFHRMETAYNIDEIPAFETQEFLIVLSECAVSGLRNTVNRILGVPA